MTQDLGNRTEPPNIAKLSPFCSACGNHDETARWRQKIAAVRCDDCAQADRTLNQRWGWFW